jgi:hypothetical protein
MANTLRSGNSIRWEKLKAVIKTLEDYDARKIAGWSSKDRILLYKYLGYCFDEMLMDGENVTNVT